MSGSNKHQLSLEFTHNPYMGREDFIVSDCNREAFTMLDKWPDWPFFALCLYGPERCGKTHLSHIFSDKISLATNYPYPIPRLDASRLTLEMPPQLFERNHCLIIENLNKNINEEAMFHLYNLYRNEGGNILFTARTAPARMTFRLPDLQSRLNIIPSIAISEPDDELLSALIIKLFMDRQIVISLDIVNYIVVNMQRSFAYAHKLVAEIDNISLAYKRAISISIVKEAMAELNTNNQGELFEERP